MKLNYEESYKVIRDAMVKNGPISESVSKEEFLQKKIKDLNLDAPPLPSDPDMDKKNLTKCMIDSYSKHNIRLLISEDVFSDGEYTLDSLIIFCSQPDNQEEIPNK
jgi:hypothetical protein